MKHRLILLVLLSIINILPIFGNESNGSPKEYSVSEVPNVRLTNGFDYISDPEQILDANYKDTINFVLKLLEDSLGVQCAIVILPAVEGNDINLFSNELFNAWGIGNKKNDNGLLIVLLVGDGQREIRFETGYGLEPYLPDATCKRIQTMIMIPYLEKKEYGPGLLIGIITIKSILEQDPDTVAAFSEQATVPNEISDTVILIEVFLFLFYLCYGLYFIIRPIIKIKKMRKDPTKSPLYIYKYIDLNGIKSPSNLGCLIYVLFWAFIPFNIIVFFISKSKVKSKATTCPSCGKKPINITLSKRIKEANYTEKGLIEFTAICPNCGHKECISVETPKLVQSSGGGSSSRGGSSGGRSWGGGRSGGGGASSRF